METPILAANTTESPPVAVVRPTMLQSNGRSPYQDLRLVRRGASWQLGVRLKNL